MRRSAPARIKAEVINGKGQEFLLKFSSPNSVQFTEWLNIAKSLMKRRFDKPLKGWVIPLAHESVAEVRKKFGSSLEIGPRLRRFIDSAEAKDTKAETLGAALQVKDAEITDYDFGPVAPYAHQKAAFQFVRNMDACGLLMEMGLGKTFVAGHAMKWRMMQGQVSRVLIVAPVSVLSNWRRELIRYGIADPTEICDLTGPIAWRVETLASLPKRVKWVLTNYEGTWRMLDEIEKREWPLPEFDAIILDESTRIKNWTAAQTKACIALGRLSKYRIIMSGKIVAKDPGDVWPQMWFLGPDVLGCANRSVFQSIYMTGKDWYGNATGWRNLDELEKKISKVSVRYMKEDCMDLPEKIWTSREVTMSEEQTAAYRKLEKQISMELDMMEASGIRVTAANVLTMYLRLQQITSGFVGGKTVATEEAVTAEFAKNAKMDALEEVLEEAGIIGNGGKRKAVIWAWYLADIERITRWLRGKGVECVAFSGSTPAGQRDELIQRFQTDPACRVFVGQSRTGGIGITLTAADLCVYYSNHWSLEVRDQSADRLHRICSACKDGVCVNPGHSGPSPSIRYVDLIACLPVPAGESAALGKTVDHAMLESLQEKRNLADEVTGDKLRAMLRGERGGR